MFKHIFIGLSALIGAHCAPHSDKMDELLGTGNDTSYSGYLQVTSTKSLHYVFVESRSAKAANDPVLIWFNGGPGCSSLLGYF